MRRTGDDERGDDPGTVPGAAGITVEFGTGVKEKLGKGGERGRNADGRKWNGLGMDGALADGPKEKEG